MNYVYFDYIPIIKKWIKENKKKYYADLKIELRDMEPIDKIRINPITTILDQRAEHLYEVGFILCTSNCTYSVSILKCTIMNL